jgi:hypothetical protein
MKGEVFMVSLKEACDKILKANPGQYIHVVNEYKDVYQFVLLNEGESIRYVTFIPYTPAIMKDTGECLMDVCGSEEIFNGDYKQYTASDLERL